MKQPPLVLLSAAALFLVAPPLHGQSPAPSPTATPQCPRFGWAEGLVKYTAYPAPPFPTDDTANVNAGDCAFHQWSWEAFVWATAIGADGRPRFTTLHNVDELSNSKAAAATGPKPLGLKPRNLKPQGTKVNLKATKSGDDPAQAGGGVLVDQDGQIVWYSTHMNDAYFKFVQLNGGANYAKAADNLNFPVGSAVFKASWKVVPDGATMTGFYTEKSSVPLLVNSKGGGITVDPSGKTRPVTVALVGLHVVGLTDNHPEFLWGTFEQNQNAPDLPPGMQPTSSNPVSTKNFTFYKANTPASSCNAPFPAPTVTDSTKQTVAPVTNVFLQYPTGNAAASRTADINAINTAAQGEMANMGTFKPPQPKETVWANYKLVGTLWLMANTLKPNDDNMLNEGVGSVNLANSTLETYFQGQGNSCFLCHNSGPPFGVPNGVGKNINISHVIVGTIPPAPTPTATPGLQNKK
jgi:hypothetical protein